ncbi:VOC family protein [Alkalihalobacillus sp. AL-G]|uniref:VOC family protein n=1 Tax=Alkalihalobacillus sp. AL-G TaxID=2926399 RepID=UPI00272A5CBF|nr:VOC family protein [Alkalihalobacillus sp. AL-G]WLD92535.1 VOC family protein [Alkalihalobacillus sp. AL-G]
MKLHHLGIETNSLERSISFYKQFGFKVESKLELMGETIVFLQLEEFRLELVQADSLIDQATSIHFALEVKDVDEVLSNWRDHLIIHEGPYNLENGWKTVFITGPSGEGIELLQT